MSDPVLILLILFVAVSAAAVIVRFLDLGSQPEAEERIDRQVYQADRRMQQVTQDTIRRIIDQNRHR